MPTAAASALAALLLLLLLLPKGISPQLGKRTSQRG